MNRVEGFKTKMFTLIVSKVFLPMITATLDCFEEFGFQKWLINSSTLYIMNKLFKGYKCISLVSSYLHQKANYFGQKEKQNQSEL